MGLEVNPATGKLQLVTEFLPELQDVLVSNPQTGDYFRYDAVLGKWKNAAGPSGGSGAGVATVVTTDPDPSGYTIGSLIYNDTFRLLKIRIDPDGWRKISGGAGTPGIYSATYSATY